MPQACGSVPARPFIFTGVPMDTGKRVDELEERYDFDYEVGEDNIHPWGLELHNPVFIWSAVLILIFVIGSMLYPDIAKSGLSGAKTWVINSFDWLFLSAGNVFVLFSLALIFLPYGRIRLGGEDAVPSFSRLSWFAMLFAAGMGIGLMFWSVAEPVGYFTEWSGTPLNTPGGDEASKTAAMGAVMYHWALHPWAIYGVVALSLAFFAYNKGMPLSIRSTFYPLFGDRVWGTLGNVIDTMAVLATIFGLATSLGFGAQQAAGGLEFLFGIPANLPLEIGIIAGVTAVGVVMARRSKASKDWAVAGGGMSGVLVAFGLAGARVGGAGTYGIAGDVMNGGVWYMWWYAISSFAALTLVGLAFAGYYRRLGLQTVGELFLLRFGSKRCQWLTSLCVQTEYAIVNVIEAYVIGVIISSLTPLSMLHSTLIAAVVLATYVSLGGLWGTAVTNVIHCTVILVSLFALGVVGIWEFGGWQVVTEQVNAGLALTSEDSVRWWAFTGKSSRYLY